MVLRQRPVDAGVELPVPDGRRGHPAVEPAGRPAAVQVPTDPHGADPQGRGRQVLQLRVPAGGRDGARGGAAVEGSDGGGRRGAEDEHHDAGPAGAADVGAAAVLRDAGGEEDPEDEENKAVHPGFQAGVRAFLHPRRGEGGARRIGEEFGSERVAHGAIENDAQQIWEHFEQFSVVRIGLRRGQGQDPERGSDLADCFRVGFQVQQRRLAGPQDRRSGQREEPLDGRDSSVPC